LAGRSERWNGDYRVTMAAVDAVSNGSPQPSVETARDEAAFVALAPEWDALVHAMPRPAPLLLHAWLHEWWRHFGAGGELAVVVARRDGRLVAAAPFLIRRRHGIRVAELLGAHDSAPRDLLLAPGERPETAKAVLDALAREPFDLVNVFGLPAGSLLARVAPRLELVERVEAPVLLMPEGFDEAYKRKTSSKSRNLHRRRLRQLGEAAGATEFVLARSADELDRALDAAFRLHTLRWAGRPDRSTFGTAEGRRFYRAALARMAALDVGRILVLEAGGVPVAFHYYFILGTVMHVHRLAFDPAYGRLSPGLVCTLEALRAAADEGVTRVEFLGGDERYKLDLADHFEPLYQGIGLARNPVAALVARQHIALIGARKRLKRSPTAQRLYVAGLAPLRRARHGRRPDA
jgi:CelD/BcsL family acetyltransferase involved in cellulose biosynthesis